MKFVIRSICVIISVLLLFLLQSQLYRLHHFFREDSEISRVIYKTDRDLTGKLITHVDTNGPKLVALTFDDGPDPLFTPDVLEILKRYQLQATFFVVGENAQVYPELLIRMIEAGHELENHTYTHPDLSRANRLEIEEEIEKTDRVIYEITGTKAQFFRPPKKLFRRETIAIAEAKGYKTVLWSICVENNQAVTPLKMAQRVNKAAKPGMIILAHDGRLNRSKTVAALPLIIKEYQKKGYRFVTLDELLKAQAD